MSRTRPSISLTGRNVLLTGASRGIGAATARALAEADASLVAHYRSGRDGADAATAALPEGQRLLAQADLAVPGAGRELWRAATAWRERIDVLVLNAGVMPLTPIDGDDASWDAGWETALRVNLLEPAALLREAVNHFVAHGGGTVVVLSSWAAQQGSRVADLPAYAASKAAIRNLAQTVARNHARDGVRVHVIAPGLVRTEMMEASAVDRGGAEAVAEGLATGKLIEPEEVAGLITFLASDACPNLSGATLDLNGASYVR